MRTENVNINKAMIKDIVMKSAYDEAIMYMLEELNAGWHKKGETKHIVTLTADDIKVMRAYTDDVMELTGMVIEDKNSTLLQIMKAMKQVELCTKLAESITGNEYRRITGIGAFYQEKVVEVWLDDEEFDLFMSIFNKKTQ